MAFLGGGPSSYLCKLNIYTLAINVELDSTNYNTKKYSQKHGRLIGVERPEIPPFFAIRGRIQVLY